MIFLFTSNWLLGTFECLLFKPPLQKRPKSMERKGRGFALNSQHKQISPASFTGRGVLWHNLMERPRWDVVPLLSAASLQYHLHWFCSILSWVITRNHSSAMQGTACYLQEGLAKTGWWSRLYHLHIFSTTQHCSDRIKHKVGLSQPGITQCFMNSRKSPVSDFLQLDQMERKKVMVPRWFSVS